MTKQAAAVPQVANITPQCENLMHAQFNPFNVRMVFLRVGWMDRYQGLTNGDTISRGGGYITDHGFGHEIFNFQPFQDKVYGYVQPPGRKDRWEEAKINLNRLGAAVEDNTVSGVLVIWVATSPLGGTFVVGWYRNATVYRNWQSPPSNSNRRHATMDCGYYVEANTTDVVLLPRDERVFHVPQQGKGAFGQANIWYADDPQQHWELRLNILRYVESRQLLPQPERSSPHQPNPLLRQKVEQIAVEKTVAHFTQLGYHVESVEKDNVGWDLNAVLGKRKLKLEVKGLSGSHIIVDLTPNEYKAMRTNRESYRVCVVRNTLTEPELDVFAYSPDSGQWETSNRQVLAIQEIIAAKCSVP